MQEIAVIYHNHLDPEWARCYDRPAMRGGILLRSYADVWDFIIDSWLALADEGFQYTEGQALVWRTYLRRHPEKEELLRQLIRGRKLEILLQGELTPETNYIPAEGLARNYLLAKRFYDDFCGPDYSGIRIAWVWDAFGNSANLPQVLRLAGAEAVGGTKYRPCPGDFWVGIDGTRLPCIDHKLGTDDTGPGGSVHYGLSRHVHCPACGGSGCTKCGGRGMIPEHPFRGEEVEAFLEAALPSGGERRFVLIGGEEVLPDPCILQAMKELNDRYAGRAVFRFGDLSEYWEANRAWFDEAAPAYTEPTRDLNPVHQGCYVTRIENKQRTRSVTYELLRAEAAIAREMWRENRPAPAPEELTLAWQNLLLNMHHDSVSGAHIDAGQAELMDYLDESESIARRYTHGGPAAQANRIAGQDQTGAGVIVKRLGKLDVAYDRSGILRVERDGRDLFGDFCYREQTYTRNNSRRIRIGELLLQCDWGDNHNAYFLGDYVTLGDDQYAVYDNGDAIWWRGRHDTGDPNVRALEWEMRVSASEDGERLEFVTEVLWDTTSKRLRAAFPIADSRRDAVWEIPYGFIRRAFDPGAVEPFSADSRSIATRPIGEYPALHWVRHDIDTRSGVAILNKGIPSARWLPGCFELSLLRSPTMTGDTVLPSVEEFWDVDGTRDTGRHRFEYAVWPYVDGLSNARLTQEGYRYNGASPEVPFDVAGDAVVTAFKPSLDGGAFILRVQEAGGTDSPLTVSFGGVRRVTPVNLMEVPCGETVPAAQYRCMLHRHQILTLQIQ